MSSPTVYVPYRTSDSHRKTSPPRSTSHETHKVALEKQLEGTRITGKGDTRSQVAPPSLKVVAGGKQCSSRSTITPTKTCSADIYRRIKRRVGRSLGAKGGLSGLKRVPRPLFQQHSPPGGTSHRWTCLPPGLTTDYHSLYHWFRTPRHGQWMHSACHGKIWTHTSFHQQPSWAKWWKSCRTTLATGLF